MKKLFWFLTLFIVLNITTVYFFLFTSFGNGIVSDIVEKNLNEKGVAHFKVEQFTLDTDLIKFKLIIDSNSVIEVNGNMNVFSKNVDLKYNVDVKDLSKLQKFTKQKLNGPVKASGTVKGDKALTIVNGVTNIFDSKTSYIVNLKDFEPDTIKYSMKGAKIQTLLHTVNQPNYANGLIDITGDITGAKPENLSGKIITKIYNSQVNIPIVNEKFKMKLKKALKFNGDIITKLEPYKLVSKVDFFTSMANVFTTKSVVNIKDGSINSDYKISIDNLANVYDISNTKMRGSLKLDGTVQKDKDLIVTGTSNFLLGKLDFKLKNDDFTANVNNIKVRSLTYMLFYPEIFDSRANAVVNYNLAQSTGQISADLKNGRFIPNKFSYLVNQLARFDLTKEVYEVVDLKSKINKEIINSDINMKSKHTNIEVKNSTLNTKKRTVDALVKTNIKGIKFDTKITGSLDKPKIKVDSSKLIQSGVKQKAMEKIEEQIGKKLGDGAAKDLLKGLKGLFQ